MRLLTHAGIAVAAIALFPSAADASITININEVGPDVVAITSGSLDLTGLTIEGTYILSLAIDPGIAYIGLGSTGGQVYGFSGLTGPSQFGAGGLVNSTTSSGIRFGINGGSVFGSPLVFVPIFYESGSPFSSTATFGGQSFSSLGVTPGQYIFTAPNDTITINIGPLNGAIPEPSAWAMMLLGFGAVGLALRRRKRPLGLAPQGA